MKLRFLWTNQGRMVLQQCTDDKTWEDVPICFSDELTKHIENPFICQNYEKEILEKTKEELAKHLKGQMDDDGNVWPINPNT